MAERELVAYPFPLDGGTVATLHLPNAGITPSEATRVRELAGDRTEGVRARRR
jgi:hypothetical protein